MKNSRMKDIAVIGLGKFGRSIAEAYSAAGGSVLAIDWDGERVQEISAIVECAIRADVTDIDVVRTLGISNVDAVVVAISDNLEAAVMATILSKEEGVPLVLAKAHDEIHAKVLRKVGADKIIFPEKEMGVRIARNLKMRNFNDIVDLNDECSIIEAKAPKSWVGSNLLKIDARRKYGINVIGMRYNDKVEINIPPEMTIEEDMLLIVIGENEQIDKVFGM